ncbi:MAG: hypothetical protein ABI378_06095 [Chitinophagaceae bacterium]
MLHQRTIKFHNRDNPIYAVLKELVESYFRGHKGNKKDNTCNHIHLFYTNIYKNNEGNTLLRFLRFEQHSLKKPDYQFQSLKARFFYGMVTLMWFIANVLKQIIRFSKLPLSIRAADLSRKISGNRPFDDCVFRVHAPAPARA